MAKKFGGKRKGLRRTGRRTTGRIARASRPLVNSAIPRGIYLPMPAIFTVALRFTVSSQEAVPGVGQHINNQDLMIPVRAVAGVDVYAEYLRPLLRIYSRAVVMKAVANYQIQNISNVCLEAGAAIMNQSSFANLPGGPEGMDRLTSCPESKYTMISPQDGGNSFVGLTVTVDTHKFLDQATDSNLSMTSTQPGVIGLPPIVGTIASPQSVLYVLNRGAAAGAFVLRQSWTFHLKFADRHAQSQTEAI